MSKKTRIVLSIVGVAALAGLGWWVYQQNSGADNTSDQVVTTTPKEASTKTISVVVTETKNLSTLNTAIATAGLAESLAGTGPYTFFAPTNAAFAALPNGTLEILLKPENKEKLADILKYHVVQGALTKSQLTNGQKLKTIEGGELVVKVDASTTYIIDAKGGQAALEKADVTTGNGTVHVVKAVLLPQ